MKIDKLLAGTLALVLIAGLGTPAFAGIPTGELITFEFEMEVTDIFMDVFSGIALAQDVEVGDTISGTYTFDSNAVGDDVGCGTFYPFENVMVTVDGEFFQSTPPFTPGTDLIFVGNDVGDSDDQYALQDTTLSYEGGVEEEISAFFFFFLDDIDKTVFDDESLPLTPPNVADFEGNFAVLVIVPGLLTDAAQSFNPEDIGKLQTFPGGIQIEGVITSLTIQDQVVGGELLPIDSTALLLAGLQSSAIWMLPVLAGVAGSTFAILYIKSRRN